jgi:hypothetical protein
VGVDMRGRLNASRDTIIPTRRVKFTLTPIYMTSNTRVVHEERAKDGDLRSPLLAQHHIKATLSRLRVAIRNGEVESAVAAHIWG